MFLVGQADAFSPPGWDGSGSGSADPSGGGSHLCWIPVLPPQQQTLPVPLLQGELDKFPQLKLREPTGYIDRTYVLF